MANTQRNDWRILVCPECGHQSTHDDDWLGEKTIYCLNHEDEPGRTERPAHVYVEVVPRSEMERLIKVVSCRCGVQISAQRIENRQRAALVQLHKMDLPADAALIVERALYDQGGKEPSPAPFLEPAP